ncbi:hypothetical protein BT69DRAFT_1375451 [Atractiella rhizophila]|nr:hypothetical protein BT69DRAFT_1375451 [Atractiella rhizophila]
MTASNSPHTHTVVLTLPAWGHLRPLFTIISTVIRRFPGHVFSIVIEPHVLPMAKAEFEQHENDLKVTGEGVSILDSIRFVVVGKPKVKEDFSDAFVLICKAAMYETVEQLLPALQEGKPFTDVQGTVHYAEEANGEKWPIPTVIWEDFAIGAISTRLRREGKHSMKCLDWVSFPFYAWCNMTFGPEDGGMTHIPGEAKAIFENPEKRGQRSLVDITDELIRENPRFSDGLHKFPGFPIRYQYEQNPHHMFETRNIAANFEGMLELDRDSDGLIVHSVEGFEPPELLRVARENYGTKAIFLVGAQQSTAVWDGTWIKQSRASPQGASDFAFLDEMQSKFGARSVVIVSFGSLFWP